MVCWHKHFTLASGGNLRYHSFPLPVEDDRRKYQPVIDLEAIPNRLIQWLLPALGAPVSKLLCLDDINDIHSRTVARATGPDSLWSTLVEETGVHYEVAASDLDRIPLTGPVVVVSNHPLGGLDGIVLGDILRRRRRDSRLMANFLLKRVIHAEQNMFFVDPFPRGDEARRASVGGMKACLKHLKGISVCLAHLAIRRSGHFQHNSDAIFLCPEFN
jgi:hypothetical protein